MRNTVRMAMLDGDADDAHGLLHEVEELLGVLPSVAAETDLAEEQWNAVKAATDELKAAFAELDKAFHAEGADKKAAYETVSADLDAALEAIRERLPMTGEATDHDPQHENDGGTE